MGTGGYRLVRYGCTNGTGGLLVEAFGDVGVLLDCSRPWSSRPETVHELARMRLAERMAGADEPLLDALTDLLLGGVRAAWASGRPVPAGGVSLLAVRVGAAGVEAVGFGDVLAFRTRGGVVLERSPWRTVAQDKVSAGEWTQEEANDSPLRAALTSGAVLEDGGGVRLTEPHHFAWELDDGDEMVVLSSHLGEAVARGDDSVMSRLLEAGFAGSAVADALAAAFGRDVVPEGNFSALVVRLA